MAMPGIMEPDTFLTGCNLLCLYCQNYEISHTGEGEAKTAEQVAQYMLRLQSMGCHNVNLVTPTHFTPQLVKATAIAAGEGLRLPIVWNCSGYENVDVIRLLEGIVDIYMPDIIFETTIENRDRLPQAIVSAINEKLSEKAGHIGM